jgi:peptidoglycan/LPS O-acetylase OafA/YrhL
LARCAFARGPFLYPRDIWLSRVIVVIERLSRKFTDTYALTKSSHYTEVQPMSALDDRRADLPDLTAARGVLALWVFAYHANLHLDFAGAGGVIGHGYLGVDGFFLLSGFVLAHRHPDPPQTVSAYAQFWWKRLVRLYPTHLAVLLLLAVAYLTASASGIRPHHALRADGHELLLQILLLNGWGFSRGWTWNYPSWSISVEWAGYLIFPLGAWAAFRFDRRCTIAALAVGVACLEVVDRTSPSGLNLSYHGALLRFFPEFAAGILLVRLLHLLPRRPPAWIPGTAGAILLALGFAFGDAVTVAGLWCLLWTLATPRAPILTSVPGLVALGALSYPVYMVYTPVELVFARIWATTHLNPTESSSYWLVAMFASVLLLAWIVATLVERPALRSLAARRPDL